MNDIMRGFKGKKTYIFGIVGIGMYMCQMMGYHVFMPETYGIMFTGMLMCMRNGMIKRQ
jgi:hypothetical protein